MFDMGEHRCLSLRHEPNCFARGERLIFVLWRERRLDARCEALCVKGEQMRAMTKRQITFVALCVGISSLGCGMFIDRAVNKAVDTAAGRVGERVGEAVAENVLGGLRPELMHTYTMALFRVLFYNGGYYVSAFNYEPGQYTSWQGKDVPQGQRFERALLHRYQDGAEWWRVESREKAEDGKENVLIMEALLAAADASGARKVRRMKAHFPNEKEAREIPVSEDQSQRWVLYAGQSLTKESLEGMTVGQETVKVPAGEFDAKHVQLKGTNDQSRYDWYMVTKIPGQVVRYVYTAKDNDGKDKQVWSMELLAHGADMNQSKLGIDFKQNDPAAASKEEATK